ncbi:Uma2 family endonuclease [Moraxella bovis]|uniref:Uncharacterized protein conserved in cyanobacteria n=2 Tax=Moraxella bovis TaxID=476 RepID=A0A378PQS9_MORBO|nr:Uma2 family endonuclease [Moraxella bovis]STY90887.1 Uncharacterized protein conserved in cyanobacteria [Moraxella bovis]
MTITSLSELNLNHRYTYADYLTWQLKEKIELIKGKIIAMSLSPTRFHQDIAWNLSRVLGDYFDKQPCWVYFTPFDVRLTGDSPEIKTVVQPDLCVVCDLSKLDDKGCVGAPDLVVEILSPSNSKKEMSIKFDLYQEAGVREYWIVDSKARTILIYVLKDGSYVGERLYVQGENQVAHSVIFDGLAFNVDKVFDLS